ncbi:deoxyribodipyrimidine photolyase [gamma proteobacterium HTCC5015]|nr:deoxyribodipyrimidine photolyase [gamma proteobacterium HTCC5015]
MPSKPCLAVWFRSDLRCHDNRALSRAAEQANAQNLPLIAFYIATPKQWLEHDVSALQVDFILRHLPILQTQLARYQIPFRVWVCDDFSQVPELLLEQCQNWNIQQLFANREYPVNEIQRDQRVARTLESTSIETHFFDDFTLLAPGSVRTGQGDPYKVFTPFKKQCFKQLQEADIAEAPTARIEAEAPSHFAQSPPESLADFAPHLDTKTLEHLWPAGESAALERLETFAEHRLHHYQQRRDYPNAKGTSAISAYLAIGSLSPRAAMRAATRANQGEWTSGSEGAQTWISELLWRDFYQHILTAFPRVSRGRAFQPHTENIVWRDDPEAFQAWCEGRTGIPIVDAAMRQLLQTGWMHNRLRMVTAMFLSKNLLIDWRRGEQYFRRQLIDGELGANNGGWQWAASTGTDAAPYFRIFNPVTQGQRFDKDGAFIRHYVPELKDLPNKYLHEPWTHPDADQLDYPQPIVDLKLSRQRAIEVFRQASEHS